MNKSLHRRCDVSNCMVYGQPGGLKVPWSCGSGVTFPPADLALGWASGFLSATASEGSGWNPGPSVLPPVRVKAPFLQASIVGTRVPFWRNLWNGDTNCSLGMSLKAWLCSVSWEKEILYRVRIFPGGISKSDNSWDPSIPSSSLPTPAMQPACGEPRPSEILPQGNEVYSSQASCLGRGSQSNLCEQAGLMTALSKDSWQTSKYLGPCGPEICQSSGPLPLSFPQNQSCKVLFCFFFFLNLFQSTVRPDRNAGFCSSLGLRGSPHWRLWLSETLLTSLTLGAASLPGHTPCHPHTKEKGFFGASNLELSSFYTAVLIGFLSREQILKTSEHGLL
jgi:hypothetical protein